MNIYLEAFSIFFKIGAFTIGGGYAMVPLIENEIVTKRNWIAKEDFIDLLAISQSAPGILAVNISIFIGYRLRREHNHCIGNHTSFVSHHPRHSVVFPQLQGQYHCRTHIQRHPPGSGCTDCRPYIQHGQIGPDKPIQHMDTGCFSTAHLAVGLLPHLDYHCSRCRGICLRTLETSKN